MINSRCIHMNLSEHHQFMNAYLITQIITQCFQQWLCYLCQQPHRFNNWTLLSLLLSLILRLISVQVLWPCSVFVAWQLCCIFLPLWAPCMLLMGVVSLLFIRISLYLACQVMSREACNLLSSSYFSLFCASEMSDREREADADTHISSSSLQKSQWRVFLQAAFSCDSQTC